MLPESLHNPHRAAPLRPLVVLLVALIALGAAIAQSDRSMVSSQLAAAREERQQLLTHQELLVRQAEALRQDLAERSRVAAPAVRMAVQPRPRA